MRKIVSIAAALMLLVTLATLATSCTIPSGGGGGGGDLIGVAMPTKSLQRWNQDGDNMKKQLEAAGYRVDLQYAADSVETQVSQIENMITKGAKVLVIASIDGESLGVFLKTPRKTVSRL